MQFQCPCGATIEYPCIGSGYNIGHAQQTTKWSFIPLADGGSIWLCTKCSSKGRELAEQMRDLIGSNDFRGLSWLLRNNEKSA